MIKVTAKNVGDYTELDVYMEGSAMDIGAEAAKIVMRLPKTLIEKCEPAFHVMRAEMVGEIDDIMAKMHKDETDGKDN
ncbi:MAG: hypothetical protein IKE74_08960 [Mogibacterium sp.]|nr:hypothetical protein [Mogibacterium sp.]